MSSFIISEDAAVAEALQQLIAKTKAAVAAAKQTVEELDQLSRDRCVCNDGSFEPCYAHLCDLCGGRDHADWCCEGCNARVCDDCCKWAESCESLYCRSCYEAKGLIDDEEDDDDKTIVVCADCGNDANDKCCD